VEIATGAAPHPILSPKLEAETDRRTRSVVRGGNALAFMPSGAEGHERRWDLVEGAARSVDIAAFSLVQDDVSRRLRDVLLARMRQGVRVRLIVDDAAIRSARSGGILRDLVAGGAEVVRYGHVLRALLLAGEGHPLRRLADSLRLAVRRRFHQRYLVADGEEAMVGALDWEERCAGGGSEQGGWRGSDVYLAGPVVADVQRAFQRDFHAFEALDALGRAGSTADFRHPKLREALARAEALERGVESPYFPPLAAVGVERLRFVVQRPYEEERLPLIEAYLVMFRAARRRIWWGCPGGRPPRIVAESLADAAARGVDVRLVTGARTSPEPRVLEGLRRAYRESSAHLGWLLGHGIRVFEWRLSGAFRSNDLVVDGVAASVGSYEVAFGSTFHHAEAGVVAYGGALPGLVEEQFRGDLRSCEELREGDVPARARRRDPFPRPLDARNLLVPPELRTPALAADLAAGITGGRDEGEPARGCVHPVLRRPQVLQGPAGRGLGSRELPREGQGRAGGDGARGARRRARARVSRIR
jgi:phosphatidylserine/phosphatidylglycerophosphate/cardiolipin synthase-like enzyme